MTIPEIISCKCDPAAPSGVPELVLSPRSQVRVPGQLDPNLRGYYPLGPSGGTDISGFENHATPSTDPVGLVDGMLCERAELMSGQQFYTLPFELDDAVTVSLFARPSAAKLEQTILSIGDNLRFGLSWYLEPIIWINERSAEEAVISAERLIADQWHHIAFVRDCNEYRVYIDGLPINLSYEGFSSSPVIANIDIEPGPAAISRYRGGGGLHGAFQDVVIRATALEADEVNAEYRSYCKEFFEVAEL